MGQEWEQSEGKVGTRTLKRDKNGNKVGTQREQDYQSETRMHAKWEQSGIKITKTEQEWK